MRKIFSASLRRQTDTAGRESVLDLLKTGFGIVYFTAFVTTLPQISGLIGPEGILPVRETLSAARDSYGAAAWLMYPVADWLFASGWFSHGLALIGILLSLAMIARRDRWWTNLICWFCWFSLAKTGEPFLIYIWDILLLEGGFILVFLSLPRKHDFLRGAALFCLKLLLFRLMFGMGLVKFVRGSAGWFDLSILNIFYPNQPLPSFWGWYLAQLPAWFHSASVIFVFFAEIIDPILLFFRRFRLLSFFTIALLNIMIHFSGNYAWFNLHTIILALVLLEDADLPPFLRRLLKPSEPESVPVGANRKTKTLAGVFLIMPALLGFFQLFLLVGTGRHAPLVETNMIFSKPADSYALPAPVIHAIRIYANFYLVNPYGLFGHIPSDRTEIHVEGSDDRLEWKQYKFRYKMNSASERPCWYAPHHSRIDHQIFYERFRLEDPRFVARSSWFIGFPWFRKFLDRLMSGSAAVTGLLAENPFPRRPPRWLRLRFEKTAFTDFREKNASGRWWKTAKIPPGRYPDWPMDRNELRFFP